MGDATHSYWGCVPGGAVEPLSGLEVAVRVARPDAACPRGASHQVVGFGVEPR